MSFITSLATSYQNRRVFEAEVNTPANIKWNLQPVSLRIINATVSLFLSLGAIFSDRWSDASSELWARAIKGYVCVRVPLTAAVIESAALPEEEMPELAQQIQMLGMTPSFTPASSPINSAFGSSGFAGSSIPGLGLAPRFLQVRAPITNMVLLLPYSNPSEPAVQEMLKKGYLLVAQKVKPKISPFELQIASWRELVLAAKPEEAKATAALPNAHHEILPGLFLGGKISDKKVDFAGLEQACQSTYDQIIAVAPDDNSLISKADRYLFPVVGGAIGNESFTVEALTKAMTLIDATLQSGKQVLVHCSLGQSRSPSIVALYLALRLDISLEQACAFMKQKRTAAMPNNIYIQHHKSNRAAIEDRLKAMDHPFKWKALGAAAPK